MAAFSEFRPYVMPDVPGCPQVMVDDAIREGCRRFSQDTWLLTYDVPAFNTVSGTQSYVLTPPSQHEVFGVKTVVKSGEAPPLLPMTEQTLARYAPDDGTPYRYWFKTPSLWLYPTPNLVVALTVEALIRPTQTATTVDNQFVEFREAITCWAKYKLMMVAGKSWYNPNDAKENYATYMKLRGEEKIRQSSGRVATPLRAVANFF